MITYLLVLESGGLMSRILNGDSGNGVCGASRMVWRDVGGAFGVGSVMFGSGSGVSATLDKTARFSAMSRSSSLDEVRCGSIPC